MHRNFPLLCQFFVCIDNQNNGVVKAMTITASLIAHHFKLLMNITTITELPLTRTHEKLPLNDKKSGTFKN